MPIDYVIDKQRRLVISIASGRTTVNELQAHQDRLSSDPDFDPEFSQLLDATAITDVSINSEDVKFLIARNIFSPNSKRAIVAISPSVFGMGRMALTYGEIFKTWQNSSLFDDFGSACEWLGVSGLSQSSDRS